MLENREMMIRLFPDLFAEYAVRPVETYTDMLLASLRASAPETAGADPTIVVLTPGPFNSAYYEHSFLADKLGAELVEGEHADNTARLLDVKYHLLLPEGERVGGQFDYFQWTTLLREVSALTAYRWVYRDDVKPWLVADLLVLNRQMPRSLASCQASIVRYLERLASDYDRRGPSQRIASAQMQQFDGADMGLPLDMIVLRTNTLTIERRRLETEDPYFRDLGARWSLALAAAHHDMPTPPWLETP